MTTVHDVAAYVVSRLGPMRSMKMQKLVYYSQAWRLAWHGEPLFTESIEAWKGGPIVRALWNRHKGTDLVKKWNGNPSALSQSQRRTVDRVLSFYGRLSGNDLSFLTHSEKPWRDAREGLSPDQPGTREITRDAIREFHRQTGALVDSDDPQEMVFNLVRKLPDGLWGTNVKHPQFLYIGHAMGLIAPLIAAEETRL